MQATKENKNVDKNQHQLLLYSLLYLTVILERFYNQQHFSGTI